MNVGARPALGAVGIFVLSLLFAPISLFASTRAHCSPIHYRHKAVVARIAHHRNFAAVAKAAAAPQLHVRPRISDSMSSAPSGDAVGLRLAGRIFVEDTPPSSFIALNTTQIHVPLVRAAVPRIVTPAVRNTSTSIANRQRAP